MMNDESYKILVKQVLAKRKARMTKKYGERAGARLVELEADVLVAQALITRARAEIAAIKDGTWAAQQPGVTVTRRNADGSETVLAGGSEEGGA